MSSTNRYGQSAGMAGLAVGCGVAVWLAGWVAAGPSPHTPPRPAGPDKPLAAPAAPLAGQSGQQFVARFFRRPTTRCVCASRWSR